MTVIAFRPPREKPTPRPPGTTAEILFFTGVRYEKLDGPQGGRLKGSRSGAGAGTGTRASTGKPRRSRKAS